MGNGMISVALCTFNGARHLAPLLESLSAQARRPAELVVCDDGSSDATWSMLQDYARRAPFEGSLHRNAERHGPCANFQLAARRCKSPFTAFADQDDVWQPGKLMRAMAALAALPEPAASLYCSRLVCIDDMGRTIGHTPIPRVVGPANAPVENVAYGCSMVFGATLKAHFLAATPRDMVMHDWWLYLLASAFGEVCYDPAPQVHYRQHTANVVGWQPRLRRWSARVATTSARLRAGRKGTDSLNQAARFVATYPTCPASLRESIRTTLEARDAGIRVRARLARKPFFTRNDRIEDLMLRLMILFGIH